MPDLWHLSSRVGCPSDGLVNGYVDAGTLLFEILHLALTAFLLQSASWKTIARVLQLILDLEISQVHDPRLGSLPDCLYLSDVRIVGPSVTNRLSYP